MDAGEDMHSEKAGNDGGDAGQQGDAEKDNGRIVPSCLGHVAAPSRLRSRLSRYRVFNDGPADCVPAT